MVKKLIKHEFLYYIRTMVIFLPLVLVLGVMTRIFRLLDNGSMITNIAVGSSIFMQIMGSFALSICTTVLGVVRFYKNMYSAEGYLTFTLPVTNKQHIFVKLLMFVLFQVIAILVIAIGVAISCSDYLGGFFAEIRWMIEQAATAVSVGNLVLFAFEFLLLVIIGAFSTPLLYYACITVGQTAKKNRILMAIVAYFVVYAATQVLSTVFTMMFSVVSVSGGLEWIVNIVTANPILCAHIFMWVMVIFSGVITWALYYVTLRIMSRKLNLE